MKKTLTYAVLLTLALMLAAPVMAQEAKSYKIGVVNRKKVFDEYDKQIEGLKKLQAERDKLQVDMDALSDSITKKQENLRDAKNLSDEERARLTDEIQSEFREYEAEFRKRQGEMDQSSKRFMEDIMKDIRAAVTAIGQEGGYDLILEADPLATSSVLYHSTSIDLTSQVILRLNK